MGPSGEGVQLSIALKSSDFPIKSKSEMTAVITNGSPHDIYLDTYSNPSDQTEMFIVALTNTAGEIRYVTHLPLNSASAEFQTIKSGQEFTFTIPITFGAETAPGDYTLIATHGISIDTNNAGIPPNPIADKWPLVKGLEVTSSPVKIRLFDANAY